VVGRPPDNEAALIARAQRGDTVAYGSLVRAHQDIAFRVACLAGGSAADAEEASQEGFVKAWRALPRFRTGSPFRPWLLAIVANEARNRRRAAGRRAGLALRAAEQAARSAGGAGASPETLVLAGARRETLLAALAALDERDRAVLTCRYLLELSEEETAAALGCRRGTVKSRTSRALERLRAHEGVEEVAAP
jgi:RNA polymerase sigma-70 factor, ECF subfamily